MTLGETLSYTCGKEIAFAKFLKFQIDPSHFLAMNFRLKLFNFLECANVILLQPPENSHSFGTFRTC